MSAVMHPVGPEEPRTYWLRRLAVVLAVVLVVAVAVWAFRPAGDDLSAVPASNPTPTAPAPGTPDPSEPATASPTPSASPTPASPTPASSSPSPSEDAEAEQEPASEDAASEDEAAATEDEDEAPSEPAACRPGDLRVTLTGEARVQADRDQDFEVSVINGGGSSCELPLSTETFELRIYSGTDRIWTTRHCGEDVPDETVTLESQQAEAWDLSWPGRRSLEGCELSETSLRPGTYVATAVYTDAAPVQLVMRLA